MVDEQHQRPPEPDRRSVLRGGAVIGLGLPLLAACGTGGPQAALHAGAQARSAGPLVQASAVPVGGGKILGDQQIVVTQPSEGDYKAFSAVCTHMQCLVTTVKDGLIICPCHGSEFSIKDGSVVRGPAAAPLPSVEVEVEHGEVLPG